MVYGTQSFGPAQESAEALIVAVGPLHALVTLLRLYRQSRDRPRLKPANPNRLLGFLAISVRAGIEAGERGVDLGDEFALAITGAQFDGTLGL